MAHHEGAHTLRPREQIQEAREGGYGEELALSFQIDEELAAEGAHPCSQVTAQALRQLPSEAHTRAYTQARSPLKPLAHVRPDLSVPCATVAKEYYDQFGGGEGEMELPPVRACCNSQDSRQWSFLFDTTRGLRCGLPATKRSAPQRSSRACLEVACAGFH